MKTFKLFSVITIFCLTATYSQKDCSDIKTELNEKNKIVATQKKNISKLESDIQYYKKTLELLNSKITTEGNNIVFKINSVVGKSDLGKVLIKGLIENKGAVGKFQTKVTELIDPQGNRYKSYKITYGGERHLANFQKNIPVKFKIEFDGIIDEVPVLKVLNWEVYGSRISGRSYNVMFKNLPITWE